MPFQPPPEAKGKRVSLFQAAVQGGSKPRLDMLLVTSAAHKSSPKPWRNGASVHVNEQLQINPKSHIFSKPQQYNSERLCFIAMTAA